VNRFLWVSGLLIVFLAALGETPRSLLAWDRAALAEGEWWRLVSGHLLHLDGYHATFNLLAAALIAGVFARVFRLWQIGVIFLAAVAAIDAGLWWLSEVDGYVGLSGVLHAYVAAALVRLIIDRGGPVEWILGILGLVKIVWENAVGAMPFSLPTMVVVTDAHLYGVLAGLLAGLLLRRVNADA